MSTTTLDDLANLSILPTPEAVLSRITVSDETVIKKALEACAVALNTTDRLPVKVEIGNVTDGVYAKLIEELRAKGWRVARSATRTLIEIREATA